MAPLHHSTVDVIACQGHAPRLGEHRLQQGDALWRGLWRCAARDGRPDCVWDPLSRNRHMAVQTFRGSVRSEGPKPLWPRLFSRQMEPFAVDFWPWALSLLSNWKRSTATKLPLTMANGRSWSRDRIWRARPGAPSLENWRDCCSWHDCQSATHPAPLGSGAPTPYGDACRPRPSRRCSAPAPSTLAPPLDPPGPAALPPDC